MSSLEKGDGGVVNARPQQVYTEVNANFRRLGNPGPLGLYAFGTTTFALSWYNTAVRGIAVPNVIVGMAISVGGAAQFVAGMWEFACANTFGATAFTMYGSFWLSFGIIYLPGSGILDAYGSNSAELSNALGIYLIVWFIITFLILIASLRKNVGLISLFFFLMLTFLLLALGKLTTTHAVSINKAAGAIGVVTAFIAFYVGTAQMLVPEESFFVLPLGHIPRRMD